MRAFSAPAPSTASARVLAVPRFVHREPSDIALERPQVGRRVRLLGRLLGRHTSTRVEVCLR